MISIGYCPLNHKMYIGLQKLKGHIYRNFKNLYWMDEVTQHKNISCKKWLLELLQCAIFWPPPTCFLVLIRNIRDFFLIFTCSNLPTTACGALELHSESMPLLHILINFTSLRNATMNNIQRGNTIKFSLSKFPLILIKKI